MSTLRETAEKMEEQLKELRSQWEEGLDVKAVIANPDDMCATTLVVLQSPRNESYTVLRYWNSGLGEPQWMVSQDGTNLTLEEVWEWLNSRPKNSFV